MKMFACLLELFQFYIHMKYPLLLTNCKTASTYTEGKVLKCVQAGRQNQSFDNKRLMQSCVTK